MQNQFFYKTVTKEEGKEEVVHEEGSFNINKIVRTLKLGTMAVVLLDDGHEESVLVKKATEKTAEQRKREFVVSEIHLSLEDYEALKTICAVYRNFPTSPSPIHVSKNTSASSGIENVNSIDASLAEEIEEVLSK